MVYGRRSYKRYHRRYRKLTKASIYGNRSARAQSRQIARINSRVNHISRSLRPDVRTAYFTYEHVFSNSAANANWDFQSINPWYTSFNGTDAPDQYTPPNGNLCKAKGLTIRFLTQYSDNYNFSTPTE